MLTDQYKHVYISRSSSGDSGWIGGVAEERLLWICDHLKRAWYRNWETEQVWWRLRCKVKRFARKLTSCAENISRLPLDSFDARILFLPGFLEAGWCEAARDPADQRRALQPRLLCWIASRSRQGRAGAALHSTQVLLQSLLSMLMPPFILF